MNRLYFGDNLKWLLDGDGDEHTNALLQINPFAVAAREQSREKQTEML